MKDYSTPKNKEAKRLSYMLENWCEEWRGTNIELIDTSFQSMEPWRKCESFELTSLAPSPAILDTRGIWYSTYADDHTGKTYFLKGRYSTTEVAYSPESRATEFRHIEIGIINYHDKDAYDRGIFSDGLYYETPEDMERFEWFTPLAIMRLLDNVGQIIDRDLYE